MNCDPTRPEAAALETTEDAALGGRLRLLQPRQGHRFGHDAVLLAAATPAGAGEQVVEFGAGVGLAGLAVAWRVATACLTLVEVDAALADLASRNAAANGLAERVRVAAFDVTAAPAVFLRHGLAAACAHRVLMNPPFNDPARQQASPSAPRRAAHMASPSMLATWCRSAARLLRPAGTLTLIWRAPALTDVLAAMPSDLGGLCVRPVHPRADALAIRVLVTATKGARAPLTVLPMLCLADAEGRPTAEAEAILRHAAALSAFG